MKTGPPKTPDLLGAYVEEPDDDTVSLLEDSLFEPNRDVYKLNRLMLPNAAATNGQGAADPDENEFEMDEEAKALMREQLAATQAAKELEGRLQTLGLEMATSATSAGTEALQGLVQQVDATKSELEQRKAEEAAAKAKFQAKREALMEIRRAEKAEAIKRTINIVEKAEAVDLAFIIDATYSMDRHIAAVKNCVRSVVTKVKATNQHLRVRLALVAYRDLHDSDKRVQTLDFVDDVAEFEAYIDGVAAVGGGDIPEDMAIGIASANKLSWNQPTRVVFIVSDCPCHGKEFHDLPDDYPDGTPDIDIKAELKTLMSNHGDGSMTVNFGKITPHTKTMLDRFAECHLFLRAVDFDDETKVVEAVTASIRLSIHKTMTATGVAKGVQAGPVKGSAASSGRAFGMPKTRNKLPSVSPMLKKYNITPSSDSSASANKWKPVVSAKVFYNCPIEDMHDLKAPLGVGMVIFKNTGRKQKETDKTREGKTFVLRAKEPFAEGECRLAYHGHLSRTQETLMSSESEFVLKCFKHVGEGLNSRSKYFKQMEESTIAQFLANKYNESLDRPLRCGKISFLDCFVIEEENDTNENAGNRRFCAEQLLPMNDKKDFIKFSNNTGYWAQEHLDETLLRFTKFVFQETRAYLMVTDLQGIKKEDGTYCLTDPIILCNDNLRFGHTNLGQQAMARCIQSTEALLKENGWGEADDSSQESYTML